MIIFSMYLSISRQSCENTILKVITDYDNLKKYCIFSNCFEIRHNYKCVNFKAFIVNEHTAQVITK